MVEVGYGDITPKTAEGKVITVWIMLVGIGFATLLIGAIAERFVNRPIKHTDRADDDLLTQVRDIAVQLQRLERAIQQRSQTHTQNR